MADLGVESLLGIGEGEDAQTLRDRLALSTRYLANWYKATAAAEGKDIWWQKIDLLRRQVEASYAELNQATNLYFPTRAAIANYDAASASWAALWRELTLSPDTIDVSLLSQVTDFFGTIAEAPGLIVPQVGNEIGKAVQGALGGFLAQTWPYLLGAGVLLAAYMFRRPLVAAAAKGAA